MGVEEGCVNRHIHRSTWWRLDRQAESGRLGGLSERPGNVSKFKIGNLIKYPIIHINLVAMRPVYRRGAVDANFKIAKGYTRLQRRTNVASETKLR